jgi:hypothetical protein
MYNILHFCEKVMIIRYMSMFEFNDLLMFFIQCNYWKRYVLIQSIFNELYLRNASCKFLMLKIIELLWEYNLCETSFSVRNRQVFGLGQKKIYVCLLSHVKKI